MHLHLVNTLPARINIGFAEIDIHVVNVIGRIPRYEIRSNGGVPLVVIYSYGDVSIAVAVSHEFGSIDKVPEREIGPGPRRPAGHIVQPGRHFKIVGACAVRLGLDKKLDVRRHFDRSRKIRYGRSSVNLVHPRKRSY